MDEDDLRRRLHDIAQDVPDVEAVRLELAARHGASSRRRQRWSALAVAASVAVIGGVILLVGQRSEPAVPPARQPIPAVDTFGKVSTAVPPTGGSSIRTTDPARGTAPAVPRSAYPVPVSSPETTPAASRPETTPAGSRPETTPAASMPPRPTTETLPTDVLPPRTVSPPKSPPTTAAARTPTAANPPTTPATAEAPATPTDLTTPMAQVAPTAPVVPREASSVVAAAPTSGR